MTGFQALAFIVFVVLACVMSHWWLRRCEAKADLAILRLLSIHPAGLVDYEIEKQLKNMDTSIRVRLGRMEESGLVESTGIPKGRPKRRRHWRLTRRYWLTEAGHQELHARTAT